jgi:lysophospholipid hydrolase
MVPLFRLFIVLAVLSTVSWFVRYRFLNMYTRLPPEPQRKEPQIDLFPDTQEGDSKPGLANYLDEFLEAIKIFGYLERPVFHELTRTMQTRKLIAGETLLLEDENGFCLVVDGLVQIFVRSLQERQRGGQEEPRQGLFGEEEDQHLQGNLRYQLLTEVKNGAAMSSLFSILSLFTEDVSLRTEENESGVPSFGQTHESSDCMEGTSSSRGGIVGEGRPLSRGIHNKERLPNVPHLDLEPNTPGSEGDARTHRHSGRGRGDKTKSVHPDIVARATVDTTIAIIPASAFRRLTRTYPRATAHIVQVILTRLQRVTLSTAHQYLGLTTEVLHMEQLMNKYTSYDLPNHLRGDALDRLKAKFKKERDRTDDEEGMKGIALHNPVSNRRRSAISVRSGSVRGERSAAAARSDSLALPASNQVSNGERYVSPGDLMSNMQMPYRRESRPERTTARGRMPSTPLLSPLSPIRSPVSTQEDIPTHQGPQEGLLHRQQPVDEDSVFRESVLGCMIKSLGLSMNTKDRGNISVEQSPRLLSYDSKRQTAVFNNAFGFMDPYEASMDGESESAMSASATSLGSTYGRDFNDELIDDVEIVFFPQGAVLVEQGERNPGVYYVIDGFLDVSIPLEEKEDRSKADRPTFSGTRSRRNVSNDLLSVRHTATSSSRNTSRMGRSKEQRKHQGRKSLFLIKPGGIAGYIGTISSYRSFTDVTAKTDVYVGFLPRASLERFTEKYPVVLLTMAKRLTSLLPRLLLHIDFALEWVQVNAGQVIHHQGDDSDAIYIVLNESIGRVWTRRKHRGT